ncbi:MAG TPA: hypothetical protein VJV23_07680 [Candidatus Polarisedimenticolia bacterium]|nr:hypothetical protein [Candidatus Polarisedimenticolia bacterium]
MLAWTRRNAPILPLTALIGLAGIGSTPIPAQETVSPGATIEFSAADGCGTHLEIPNTVEELARTDASCNAAQRALRAEVRPLVGPQWIGLTTVRGSAFMWNDFEVLGDAETTGNTVGAWISYDAHWKGRVLFIGFFSSPTVELAIRLRDLTAGKTIKGEIIWGRDGDGAGISIPYIPFDLNLGGGKDEKTVSNTFPAVLTRGHTYRLEMVLTCAVFSDGGLDVGSECDYMDNFPILQDGGGAGWSRLAVKVGIDEAEVLQRLEELANHTHTYLTGRGVGHNNTAAETGPPMEGSGAEPAPERAVAPPGRSKKRAWFDPRRSVPPRRGVGP